MRFRKQGELEPVSKDSSPVIQKVSIQVLTHENFLIVPKASGSALNNRQFSGTSPVLRSQDLLKKVLIQWSNYLKPVISSTKLKLQQSPGRAQLQPDELSSHSDGLTLEKACSLLEVSILFVSLLFFSTKCLAFNQTLKDTLIILTREKNVAHSWEEIVYRNWPRNNPEVEIITHGLENKCDKNAFKNLIEMVDNMHKKIVNFSRNMCSRK